MPTLYFRGHRQSGASRFGSSQSDTVVVKVEGLRRDIAQFLSLPIPREVWEKIKVLQNDDFVAFVESCRNWK